MRCPMHACTTFRGINDASCAPRGFGCGGECARHQGGPSAVCVRAGLLVLLFSAVLRSTGNLLLSPALMLYLLVVLLSLSSCVLFSLSSCSGALRRADVPGGLYEHCAPAVLLLSLLLYIVC